MIDKSSKQFYGFPLEIEWFRAVTKLVAYDAEEGVLCICFVYIWLQVRQFAASASTW